MKRKQNVPEVDAPAEFLEIISDFRDPRDAVREAMSNAFDAGADTISVEARIEKFQGDDELVLEFEDDGEGMVLEAQAGSDVPSIKAFFDLGRSTWRGHESYIGKKGHGTKTYFNCRQIEVQTWREGKEIYALMDSPKSFLSEGQVPPYEYEPTSASKDKYGTKIVIRGYNRNVTRGFSHYELRDFILWFTKFGSVELEVGRVENKGKKLRLTGLGREEEEVLDFGHVFPPENYNLRELKRQDPASPSKYFVKKWDESAVPVKGFPHVKLDIVFYIEGDKAKGYNTMIRRPGRPTREGMYSVEDRYGLWACRDYIPIQRMNDWIAVGKLVWTKYHAFVNCQDFHLTANRGDVGNTPHDLLTAIGETVEEWFTTQVQGDRVYKRYSEELEREKFYRRPRKEAEELRKRKGYARSKKVFQTSNEALLVPKEIELIEPRQEAGVFGLFCTLYALNPDLFNLHIVDYDTHKGYDALALVDLPTSLNGQQYRFVEFKRELEKEFDHSFDRLAAVVCWDCNLGDGDSVTDIKASTRTLKITKPGPSTEYTKYMLVSDIEPHNIEVYVLKDYLKERLGIEFRPRGVTRE